MSVNNGMSKVRKSLALAATAGVVVSMAAIAAPAQAAEQTIDDVTLSWAMNAETGAGAYNGSCNFLSAGEAGNTESSRAWTEGDGFYSSKEGDVTILAPKSDGTSVQRSFADRCKTGDGVAVSPFGATVTSNNYIQWANGSGKVDTAAGTATISWEGSFTGVSYGGLFYFSASDPVLTVASNGTATLKATASGYGADQADASVWTKLPAKTVTLANLTGVEVDADGFTVTPDYANVTLPESFGQAGPGAFPVDFVEYQQLVGGASYWYSSGGSADPRKVATPLSVEWAAAAVEEPSEPEVPSEDADSKDIDVDVKVPEKDDTTDPEPEVKEFKWSIADATASLGTAAQNAAGFSAAGTLPNIKVTDTRAVTGGWDLTGKASDFTAGSNSFGAKALGWTPAGIGTEDVVTLGSNVAAGSGNGLSATSILAQATGASTAELSTGIQLQAPTDAPAGDYTSTLTITAIQK